MSRDYIRRIKITQNRRVFIEYKNDVTDYQYRVREHKSLSEILQNEGTEAVEKEILMLYFYGSWEGSPTKYARAVKRTMIAEGIDQYEAWDKSYKNDLYRNSLKETFYKTLHSHSKPRKCRIETLKGQPIKAISKKTVTISNTGYKTFSDEIAAKIFIEEKNLNPDKVKIVFLGKTDDPARPGKAQLSLF